MKKLMLLLTLIGVMLLAACGTTDDTTEEDVSDEAETEEVVEEETEEESEETGSTEEPETAEVIYDENDIVITYLGIEQNEDEVFGDRIKIRFDVENNTDRNIVIQSEELSADGRMVNEAFVTMSDEVSAGKIGSATLDIMEIGDDELPSMEENVELTLKVFDWDDYDFRYSVPVSIDLK